MAAHAEFVPAQECGALVVWDGSRGSGWTQKESRCPRKAEESRPGELRELWGAAPGKVIKGSSLSPNWWEITPWGLLSPGTCLTPHPVCSGGDRSPCAPRAGGDVLGHPLLQQRLGLSFNCAHSMGLKKVFTFTFPCVWFVIAAEQQAMLWLSRSQHI